MATEIEKALSHGGWSVEQYKNLNPDLGPLQTDQLVRHFLMHGLSEGRKYSELDSPQINVENVLTADGVLLAFGWSSVSFDSSSIIMVNAAEGREPVIGQSESQCVWYWRNDVATHLGVPVKSQAHGFVLAARSDKFKKISSETKVYLAAGGRLSAITAKPSNSNGRALLIEGYRHLQGAMVYDELIYTLGKVPKFVELLGDMHAEQTKSVPIVELYDSKKQNEFKTSICAVALGNAAMLKVWLMELASQSWMEGCELNLLCNGPMESDRILSVCKWYGEVAGRQIKLYYANENIGFNSAVNYLVAASRGVYALVTNTDVAYRNVDIERMSEIVDSGASICVARQFNSMGALQHLGLSVEIGTTVVHGKSCDILSTSLIGRNTFIRQDIPDDHEVEHFGAAAFFAKTALLRTLGPFNPKFLYAYHEDTDLANRAAQIGCKMIVTKALEIVHYESSAAKVDLPKTFLVAANTVKVMAQIKRLKQ